MVNANSAYTPCFCNEPRSAGYDVHGIKRGHQFDKVEMYMFVMPGQSYQALENLRRDAEACTYRLELPFRTKLLCTGDIGFGSTKPYDIDVWAPGVGEWLEISSCSNVEACQARRANVRYRPEPGVKMDGADHTVCRDDVVLLRSRLHGAHQIISLLTPDRMAWLCSGSSATRCMRW